VRRRYARHGITVTGYVPDIRPYVQRAACFVVPLRVGGGTRLKILDAWAMGAAVVSTPEGCEGLDARHGANIMVARDPEEFALQVLAVLEDAALRNALGAGGRRTVETTYDWGIVGGVMLDELRRARRSRGGSGR
jgi:glycosyltransferase involved in cell wall biosynthesis